MTLDSPVPEAAPSPEAASSTEVAPSIRRLGRLRPFFRAAFLLSTILAAVAVTYFVLALVASATDGRLDTVRIVLGSSFLAVAVGAAAGCLALTIMDHSDKTLPRARLVTRWTLVLVVASIVLTFMTAGIRAFALVYLFQLVCLIAFQLTTDPNLSLAAPAGFPWAQPETASEGTRKGYIPLNFFNVFWVFMVASVLGLIIEVLFRAITTGTYEDRAGVLWGPFSPIYGFGAVLMTVALNRFWDKSKLMIFGVAGLIGSAFEFGVSFFMQKAFGITAWDYSGTFLNIGGRTNFAFFCAWGLLGLAWIKLILPDVLRLVDRITLHLRTALTVAAALFMLANGTITLIALDSWYGRNAGEPQTSAIQKFVAEHFDDTYMENRFQTMTLDPGNASRI